MTIKNIESKNILTHACSFMWSSVFQLNVHRPKSTINNLPCANQKTTTNMFIHSLGHISWANLKEVILKIKEKDIIVIDEVSMTTPFIISGNG